MITPEEIQYKVNDTIAATLLEIEGKMDKEIIAAKLAGLHQAFLIIEDYCLEIREAVEKYLVPKYKQVGWDCSVQGHLIIKFKTVSKETAAAGFQAMRDEAHKGT